MVSLFSTSSWIKTTTNRLSYELGVNGEKKVNENWDIINKNWHSTFHTGKTGNFNSLREVIWIILRQCYLKIDWKWESVPKKVLRLLISFRWYVWGMSLKLLDHTRRHCCRNSGEKLQKGFIIVAMRSYLLEEQLQMQSTQKFHFVCVYKVIIKCFPNFITCFNLMR